MSVGFEGSNVVLLGPRQAIIDIAAAKNRAVFKVGYISGALELVF